MNDLAAANTVSMVGPCSTCTFSRNGSSRTHTYKRRQQRQTKYFLHAGRESMALFGTAAGTDIPLEHLSYEYVKACSSAKEVGEILKILRSGREGHYPDLITLTENRLAELDPTSKLLIKVKPAKHMTDLPKEEFTVLKNELENWVDHVTASSILSSDASAEDTSLPPIRSTGAINKSSSSSTSTSSKPAQRLKSNDYDGWANFDVEKEAVKIDMEVPASPDTTAKASVPCELSEKEHSLPHVEKVKMSVREKEKGNEAYRAGDMDEAYSYYSRSLLFNPSVTAYNNRAITEIKLKMYQAAVDDCSLVLQQEPTNTKGLFRRGTAYAHIGKVQEAASDFELVLHFEPNNKKAQQELNLLRKKLAVSASGEAKKGLRIQIEEDDDEDDDVPRATPPNVAQSRDNIQNSSASTNGSCSQTLAQAAPSEAVSASVNGTLTPTPPPPLPPQVQALKNKGNELFRAGQYAEATKNYTLALALLNTTDDPHVSNLSTLLNNLAACHLKNGDCHSCISDCSQSLALVPVNIKALMRRAQAYEHLEKYKHAYNDYQLALSIDRTLTSAYQASSRITRLLRDLEGDEWRSKLPAHPEASQVREELQQMGDSFSQELPCDGNKDTADKTVPDSSQDGVEIEFKVQGGVAENQMSSEPMETSNVPPPMDSPGNGCHDNTSSEQVISLDSETSQFKDSMSSDEMDSSDTLNSVSSGCSQTVTPPIASAPGSAETKVTQSTQAVPSPRMSAPPSSKVKEDSTSPEEKFDKHKQKGNEHVKKGEYLEALHYYDMCASLCPNRTVGYTNRALCHLKLNSPRSAEDDCNKALSYEPGNPKALYRRALARKALHRYADSLKDLKVLLAIDSDNLMAKREFTEVKQLWEKQLRDIQAKASPEDSDRRHGERKGGVANPKSEAGKNPDSTAESLLDDDLSDIQKLDEKVKKLLETFKQSKESIEQFAKLAPPRTSRRNGKGSRSPATGTTTTGKSSKAEETRTNRSVNGSSTAEGSNVSGKTVKSSKRKKVTKKPPKSVKQEKAMEPATEQPPPQPNESNDLITVSKTTHDGVKTQEADVKAPSPPTRGKEIVVEVENGSSEEKESERNELPTHTREVKGDCVSAETAAPIQLQSPFEFVKQWNAIPRKAQSSDYARLLEAIPPTALPNIITNKLDGTMLTNIIHAVDREFVNQGKYQLSADVLTSLSKVPRFGMVAMFMDPSEKADLSRVLSILSSQLTHPILPSTIADLKQLYGVV